MTTLQVANRTITATEIPFLLASYQLLRKSIINQAIAFFSCTPEEIAHSCQQFYQRHQLTMKSLRKFN